MFKSWPHLSFAVRMYLRNPLYFLTAVATLAIGSGAAIAVYSLVNAILLRPLPYPAAGRIVVFMRTSAVSPVASPAQFNFLQRNAVSFADMSAYRIGTITLGAAPDLRQATSAYVTPAFLPLLGAQMALGRQFTAIDDRPNGGDFVILGYDFWQRQFGGDTNVLGRVLPIDNRPHTVIGVIGRRFETDALPYAPKSPDVLVPLQLDTASNGQGAYLVTMGRLRDRMSLDSSNVELKRLTDEFRRTFPTALTASEQFFARPLSRVVSDAAGPSLRLLSIAVVLLLLIAVANAGSLVLMHTATRTSEFMVRHAIGASSTHIWQQLAREVAILSIFGCLLGLFLGHWLIQAFLLISPVAIPRIGEVGSRIAIDPGVMVFALIIAIGISMTLAVLAWFAVSQVVCRSSDLKPSVQTQRSTPLFSRTRGVLVGVEGALATILLIVAALLVQSYSHLRTVNIGFEVNHIVTMQTPLSDVRFGRSRELEQLVHDGVLRLLAVPGVVSVTAARTVPFENDWNLRVIIEGRPLDGPFHVMAAWRMVSAGYFETLEIPILQGRAFSLEDTIDRTGVVIINQAMSARLWPGTSPLGSRLLVGKGAGPEFDEAPRVIVGISADVRDGALSRDPRPTVYLPIGQVTDGVSALLMPLLPIAWIVRTEAAPLGVVTRVTEELRRTVRGAPIGQSRSLNEVVSQSLARQRFDTTLVSVFAGAAIALAAIGVYGLTANGARAGAHAIGIRLALGATQRHVLWLMVANVLLWCFLGTLSGMMIALALSRVISGELFGVNAWDPVTLTVVPILVCLLALIAAWIPARRVSGADPARTLREA